MITEYSNHYTDEEVRQWLETLSIGSNGDSEAELLMPENDEALQLLLLSRASAKWREANETDDEAEKMRLLSEAELFRNLGISVGNRRTNG